MDFLDFHELVFDGDEGVDQGRVEVASPAFEDDRFGDFVGEGGLVDALAGEGVIDVGDGDDATAEGDREAGDLIGITCPVVALVMRGGYVAGHLKEVGSRMFPQGGIEGFRSELGV